MKNRIKILLLSFLTIQLSCRTEDKIKYCDIDNKYSYKVDSVLRLMTLDEQIGQLNQ